MVTFGVPRILIVFVNEPLTRDFDTVPLHQAVLPLRIANVKVFVIGIGRQVNRNDLNVVADDEKNVFLARDFDDVLARSREIIQSWCSGYLPSGYHSYLSLASSSYSCCLFLLSSVII